MEAKTDLDTSRKFSTEGCSMDFGTFDKYGFISVPSSIGGQCQSAPGTGDCAAATQASSLQESDSSAKIAALGKDKVQRKPITKDPGESQASSLQETDSSNKIAPPGEGKVQKKKTPTTRVPGESVADVIVDKLTKRKLDHVDSPEIITGGFRRAKLMDNLRYLALINKMANWKRRKESKTSG